MTKKVITSLIVLSLIFTLNNCKKDNPSVELQIGQSYQGGYIACFLQQGDPGYDASVKHGLIAAPYDQSTGVQWYNGSSVFTGANGIAIGTGNENTNAIVSIQGVGNYAAKLCSDLDIGGYSDWYLPSKNELSKLFINRVAIGGFANSEYWSSSEYIGTNNWKAWSQSFSDGGQHDYSKDYVFNVRAVRAF